MFERMKTSFAMVGTCWGTLRREPGLLLFPVLSAISLGAFFLSSLAENLHVGSRGAQPLGLLLFYLVTYLITLFFNTALTHVVIRRLDGEPTSLGTGLAFAAGRLPALVGYALVAATVGVVARLLGERLSFIGRLIGGLIGAGWAVATAMVVPVLAAEDVGPLDAIGRSVTLMKETWGENLVSRVSLRLPIMLITVVLFFFWLPAFVSIWTNQTTRATMPTLFIVTWLFALTLLVASALTAILGALLYRYARDGGAEDDAANPLAGAYAAR